MALPTAPITAAGLIGGFLTARTTDVRPLGGVVLAAAGVVAGRQWVRTVGPAGTAGLVGVYLLGFGASRPAVLAAAGTSAAASYVVADRRH